MRKSISIEKLEVGMFIEAEVASMLVDNEIRHFLEPRAGTFSEASNKRVRLMGDRRQEVERTGGLLVTSQKSYSRIAAGGAVQGLYRYRKRGETR